MILNISFIEAVTNSNINKGTSDPKDRQAVTSSVYYKNLNDVGHLTILIANVFPNFLPYTMY
jgi:hypothetical protein